MKLGTPSLAGDVHCTPLAIARDRGVLAARGVDLVELPGGTADVARALAAGDVDLGLGLTEGLIAAIAGGADFRLVATAVETPLRWAVLTPSRSPATEPADLVGARFGITRRGGGAHLTALLLAREHGWREGDDLTFVVADSLDGLVEASTSGAIDAFLWEALATRPLVERGALRSIGAVTPGWPALMLGAPNAMLAGRTADVRAALAAFQDAVELFEREVAYVHALVMRRYDLSRDDAERWWSAVRFSPDGAISRARVGAALAALQAAHLVPGNADPDALLSPDIAPVRDVG